MIDQYRAIAVGPNGDPLLIDGGRTVQSVSQCLEPLKNWANLTANQHGCRVIIYKSYERIVQRVKPTIARKPKIKEALIER